ncbi:MAG: baseplate J/gp47 family protein [Nitrospinaceae bacterium]
MAIPTTQQATDQNIANFEAEIGQTTPINDKAFIRVISAVEAILSTSLHKFGIDRAKQVLATTAFGSGLDDLGNEYGVPRKVAVAAGLTATLPGTDSTVIPTTVDFVGGSNGIRYALDANAVVTGGFATLSLTAKTAGSQGNLNNGETLSIGTQIAGAETIATVTDTTTTGVDEETDDDYRVRILDVVRSPGGGGNAADYRNWAQETVGVVRAYPYAGKPADLLAESSPPDRVVYIESTTAIDADGIPPQSLLDDARTSITTDPETGLARQPLGLTDDTLFVEAIIRTPFFVQITGLIVESTIEAAVKDEIEAQLTAYFLSLDPFIDGVDSVVERDDLITDLTVSNVVQDVLSANGGSAQAVAFDINFGGSLPEYQLGQGEKAKLEPGGITYV